MSAKPGSQRNNSCVDLNQSPRQKDTHPHLTKIGVFGVREESRAFVDLRVHTLTTGMAVDVHSMGRYEHSMRLLVWESGICVKLTLVVSPNLTAEFQCITGKNVVKDESQATWQIPEEIQR